MNKLLLLAVLAVPCRAELGATAAQLSRVSVSPAVRLAAERSVAELKASAAPAGTRVLSFQYIDGFWDRSAQRGWPWEIRVREGERVTIHLANWSWAGHIPDGIADFNIDGLEATVDGVAVKYVHVRLKTSRGKSTVEFSANKPGYYWIYGHHPRFDRIGKLIISPKK